MKSSKGQYPPPHLVMEKLLEPVWLEEGFDDGYSKPNSKSRIIDHKAKPAGKNLKDWFNSPLFKNEISGETEL